MALPYRLNSPLAEGGGVASFQISPDSAKVVYRADQEADETFELYSVPIGDGTVTKLNSPLVTGGNVQPLLFSKQFFISPDSTTVVYKADQEIDEVFELYSVPIGGGTVTKLNDSLVTGGDVSSVMLSSDSSTAVYTADQGTDGVFELYAVPIGGGTVTKLNSALVAEGDVDFFGISSDSSRVVYRADQETDGVYELYSVPISGGTVTKLNSALSVDGYIRSFGISPDSSTVVYIADQDSDDIFELYSVPISGGTVTKLNDPIPSDRCVGDTWSYAMGGFGFSHDSQMVVYTSYCYEWELGNHSDARLFSVPIHGGTVTMLHDTFGSSIKVLISPDSSLVVYKVCDIFSMLHDGCDYYSTPIGGGTVTHITSLSHKGPDGLEIEQIGYSNIAITPDSSKVVYTSDEDTVGVVELFTQPVSGGIATKLNLKLDPGYNVTDFVISPDSQTIVYSTEKFLYTNNNGFLFSVPINGGTSKRINSSRHGAVFEPAKYRYEISPDSTTVIYNSVDAVLYTPWWTDNLRLYGRLLNENIRFPWGMYLPTLFNNSKP